MNVIEYEKLLWNRDHLAPNEQKRLAELDLEDERVGNSIAGWWFPEIIAGWLLLLFVLGLLVFG